MRKLTALLLALILSFGLFVQAEAAFVTDDDVIRAVLVVFRRVEGSYDSVNRNDNGALSVGKLQWHGVRALELVKEIIAADPAAAFDCLGESLYQEAVSAGRDAWDFRTVNAAEAAQLSALLATPQSIRIQDAVGRKDIGAYITHARTYDIRTAEAMVYYCDLENQYGPGGAASLVSNVKEVLGKASIENVDEFHEALLQVTSYYHERRNWTWQYARSIDWNNLGAVGQEVYQAPIPPNLDVEPPKILDSRVVLMDAGTFRVELRAADNKRVTDCRVQVETDAQSETPWAAYCDFSGSTWTLPVKTAQLPDCTRYYITATASDAAGNGTSVRLELERRELDALRTAEDTSCAHSFSVARETAPSCEQEAVREERCEKCGETRMTILAPALGHSYERREDGLFVCTVCGMQRRLDEPEESRGVIARAVERILASYQDQTKF